MKFKIGQKVKVINCHSGADFSNVDIVTIVGIGFEDDPDCYKCLSDENDICPWYLYEDEVDAITNGDRIRSMGNIELANFIKNIHNSKNFFANCNNIEEWLEKED